VSAELVHELVEAERELALAAADERLLRDPLVRVDRDLGGGAHRLELALVLDRAQPLDLPVPRNELQPRSVQQLPVRVRQLRRFERDLPLDRTRDPAEQGALHFDELHTFDVPCGFRVPEVREQHRALLVDEQRDVRALEPRQIAHIDRRRDQERLGERAAQTIDAAQLCVTRNSSASR
jgi:hypothetical protein